VFLGRVKPLGGGSEIKLTELGMISNPGYKICFVLDKTSMFKIVSSTKGREKWVEHSVKPLQIIWTRNFALNLGSGLKCTAYHRKKKRRRETTDGWGEDDAELLGLGRFLELLATQLRIDQSF
jgi:ubiquitin-like domain-containing CTD phosphatase 1